MKKVYCFNCDRHHNADDVTIPLKYIPCLNERLDPGGIVPYGECPVCNALVYLCINNERNCNMTEKELYKTAYYYFKDKNNQPRVTICIVKDHHGNIAKGMAICSLSDSPDKNRGRHLSLRKALRALSRKKSSCPISRQKAVQALMTVDRHVDIVTEGFKSFFPRMQSRYKGHTPFEQKIIESWN